MKTLLHLVFFSLLILPWGSAQAQSSETVNALQWLERGKPDSARALLSQLHQTAPTIQTYFYNGYAALRANQLPEAAAFFEKGLALDEKRRPLNKAGLGIVAFLKGNSLEADRIFEEVLKESKGKDTEILQRIGEAYTGYTQVINNTDKPLYAQHNAEKALKYLEMALKRDSKNGLIQLSLGDARALATPSNGGPAVTAYENALALMPNKSLPNHRIANIYRAARSAQLAGDFYKAAIKADSLYAPSYLQLAELNFQNNQFKEAADNMDRYLRLAEKQDAELRYRSGQFDYLARQYARGGQK
jgi:tetratricopeptide (TPR) repeat protein